MLRQANSMMRRQREDMQVNVSVLRRNLKNLAHNYSDAQIKVREATSNDTWGPSTTLLNEIADLTYNVVAFTEMMHMIWKRLNDHGRNWRHVYKALNLLDYLIKTGSEKVAQQCKENIHMIQTLSDFQYLEEGQDKGYNVREKAKSLVQLLMDDERLRNERAKFLKAKERFAQTSSGFGSDTAPSRDPRFSPCVSDLPSRAELECARPQTAGEEELQLQLALAMSREEAEQEEQKKRSDDVRLKLALSQSENEFKQHLQPVGATAATSSSSSSHVLDLLEVDTSNTLGAVGGAPDPWGLQTPAAPPIPSSSSSMSTSNVARPQVDPWSCPAAIPPVDPWAPVNNGPPGMNVPLPKPADPWAPVSNSVSPLPIASNDPWSLPPEANISPADEFAEITNRNKSPVNGTSLDPFDVSTLTEDLKLTTLTNPSSTPLQPIKKTPQSFLGENSALVNLDNLITVPPTVPPLPVMQAQKTGPLANPFNLSGGASSGGGPSSSSATSGSSVFHQSTPPNLFEAAQQPRSVSINQMRQHSPFTTTSAALPQPLVPQPNPFLS